MASGLSVPGGTGAGRAVSVLLRNKPLRPMPLPLPPASDVPAGGQIRERDALRLADRSAVSRHLDAPMCVNKAIELEDMLPSLRQAEHWQAGSLAEHRIRACLEVYGG
jgi:hypothetical protein